jgi:hypothetical protein
MTKRGHFCVQIKSKTMGLPRNQTNIRTKKLAIDFIEQVQSGDAEPSELHQLTFAPSDPLISGSAASCSASN